MANQEHFKRLKNSSVEEWNKWRFQNPDILIELSNADISNINLRKINLSQAELFDVNFSNTNLTEANLYKAKIYDGIFNKVNLAKANLCNAELIRVDINYTDLTKAELCGVTLSESCFNRGTKLNEADFCNAHLIDVSFSHLSCFSNANFQDANLNKVEYCDVDLNKTNFQDAHLQKCSFINVKLINSTFINVDLSNAEIIESNLNLVNLKGCQAINTKFENVILTGACIEGWNIHEAIFKNITCDYIYFKQDKKIGNYIDRRPSDKTKIFNPGDFERLIEKSRETVDLIFSQGIDWDIFLQSFNQLRDDFPKDNLTISAIEKKSDGVFVVKVEVPENSDKSEIEASFWKQYQPLLDAKDAHIKSLEYDKKFLQEEIESKRKENTDLRNILETLAAQDRTIYNTYNNSNVTYNNFPNARISGGVAGRDYNGDVNNNSIHTNTNDEK